MNAKVYDVGQALDRPQKAKPPAKTGSAEWIVIAALLVLALHSGRFRRVPPEPVDRRRGNYASQRPLLCVALACSRAYREFQPVRHSGRFPVLNRFPAAQARLASCGRSASGSVRIARWAFRSVDDSLLLSPPGWRR